MLPTHILDISDLAAVGSLFDEEMYKILTNNIIGSKLKEYLYEKGTDVSTKVQVSECGCYVGLERLEVCEELLGFFLVHIANAEAHTLHPLFLA